LEEPVSSSFTLKGDAKKAAGSTILFLALNISSDKFVVNCLKQMVVVLSSLNSVHFYGTCKVHYHVHKHVLAQSQMDGVSLVHPIYT